ncbi:MAG: 30S ribosomal protein S19 [Methanococcoides sp.]|jgi:small subunit ribosomal protein S19|nr:30S ribosomal protein S19 [Methanococcoides sp.]MCD4821375.1 30S ribosomal protein S19 [Methanococcoides sp.]
MAKKSTSRLPKRKGEYTFRGKTVAQLQEMSFEDFAELLPAQERRSIRRGLSDSQMGILQQFRDGKESVRTHYRNMIIFPEMIGKALEVYNGKEFVKIEEIMPEMIGHRFGEYSPTRNRVSHGSAGVGATRSSKFVPLK